MANIPWAKLLGAAVAGYSAYEAGKEGKEAADFAKRGTTATRQPYGSEFTQDMLPWIFQEAMARYQGRLGKMGITPTDASAAMSGLAGIPSNYSGVNGQPEQFADPAVPASPQGPVAHPMASRVLGGDPAMAAEFAEIDPSRRYWEVA